MTQKETQVKAVGSERRWQDLIFKQNQYALTSYDDFAL